MQFKDRSKQKEFLDNDDINTKDLYQNLKELDVINSRLGGHNASRKGLAEILNGTKTIRTILDIGFGGGDAIKQLQKFGEEKKVKLFFYGVDLKKDCLDYAEKNLVDVKNKLLICDDYRNISEALLKQVDVIHCSLFLHHLTNDEIVELMKFCRTNGCVFLANDLQRHWFAYYSIKFLSAIFSKSYLVKNDAPISVKRGFKKNELKALVEKAGYINYKIKWSWAFRYIVIASK